MPRRPKPTWHVKEQVYRTEVGGRTKRFYGIARGDELAIAQAMALYLAELDAEFRPPEPTAEDLVLAFLKAPLGKKPRTLRGHQERCLVFLMHDPGGKGRPLGGRRCSELKAGDLKAVMKAMELAGNSASYISGVCSSVKAAFAWGASDESGNKVASNPFDKVKGPKLSRSPERYAERAEVAAFLRFARADANGKTPLYRRFARLQLLMVRVALHTGARPGSLASAWWSDFSPEKGSIVLPPDRHKTGAKTKKPLVILLPPAMVRALARERDRDVDDGGENPGRRLRRHPVAIFTHKRGRGGVDRGAFAEAGEPWGQFTELPNGKASFDADTGPFTQAIRKLRLAAIAEGQRLRSLKKPTKGLELIRAEGDNRFVVYRLRHTYISDGLMGGLASASVAALTGTSDRMVAQVYGHLLEGHLKTTAEEIHAKRRRK